MKIFMVIMIPVFCFTSCASPPVQLIGGGELTREDYDTSLLVKPVKVRWMEAGSTVDALTAEPEEAQGVNKIVILQVLDVLAGEFTMPASESSLYQQVGQAAQDRRFLTLLTMDFVDPSRSIEKEWLSVGVADVYRHFRIQDWENPESRLMKVYLRKHSGGQGYLLAGVHVEN